MRPIVERATLTTTLLSIAIAATAHHSTAIYSQEREVTLEGAVAAFHWVSPHVYIDVAVAEAAEEPVTWSVEAGSPQVLTAAGWSSASLAPGDHVVVTATPARNPDSKVALVKSVLKADGTLLTMPGDTNDIAGAVRLTQSQSSCPRVDMTLIAAGASPETRPVKLGDEVIFVSRTAITTTNDISEIRVAGDDVLASIQIEYKPEAAIRLFDATSNRDGLEMAFVVDDDVWLAFTWGGPDGIGPGGTQISLRNGMDRAKKLVESIEECAPE